MLLSRFFVCALALHAKSALKPCFVSSDVTVMSSSFYAVLRLTAIRDMCRRPNAGCMKKVTSSQAMLSYFAFQDEYEGCVKNIKQ